MDLTITTSTLARNLREIDKHSFLQLRLLKLKITLMEAFPERIVRANKLQERHLIYLQANCTNN
jgi:hypothetical protein